TLAETLDAAQAESIRFIEKWDAIGNECATRADRFLGALSAACQKIRTAQRRGETFRFGFECYRLGAIHEELFEHYRVTSMQQQLPAEVETALVANEHRLASFCSKDTYASHYPAFAAIFADAEALKYYPPRIQGAAGVNVAASRTRFREIWQQTGVTATSIDPMHISSWSPGPQPGSYPPAPVFVANGDGGVSPSPTPSAP